MHEALSAVASGKYAHIGINGTNGLQPDAFVKHMMHIHEDVRAKLKTCGNLSSFECLQTYANPFFNEQMYTCVENVETVLKYNTSLLSLGHE